MSENLLIFFRENQDLLLAIVSLLTLVAGQRGFKSYKRRQRRKALECKFPMTEKNKEDSDGISKGMGL